MAGYQRSKFAVLAALLALAAGPTAAAAQYPTKPVRLIVPFPPGGSNDIVGRMIGHELTGRLGQQVIIDNRAGAGGIIGSEIAANAAPDGYTLLIISVAYAYNPSIYKSRLKFNPEKSFAPVAMLGTGPNVLAVNPKVPVGSVKELIAMAKAKPGALAYATAGLGSFQHLGSEMFRVMTGVDMLHVPFKGGGPAMADVIAGNTQVVIGTLVQTMPFIKSGRLKPLGVGSAKRNANLPDVPTIAEAGVPGYEASNWWGIVSPADTPAAVVKRLHTEVDQILASTEIQKKLESQGGEVVRKTPVEFGKFIGAETVKWNKVVREAGIKSE
jgi:tripartite-type tricarboxylate transporter receptor subunit TctC